MAPLHVVLVGIEESLVPTLRYHVARAALDVECEFHSALMAIDCLRHYRKQPRILLVQIGEDCDEDTLRRLTMDLSGWPILALLPSWNAEEFVQVNRAGAAQVVPLPLDPADLRQALSVISCQADRGTLDRHVLAVTGAAPGCGATTVAVCLAREIADRLKRATILAELNLEAGSLAPMLGVQPRITLSHLIREMPCAADFLVEKALVPVTDRLRILAGPQELNPDCSVASGHVIKIVGCLKQLTEVTVLDMPGTFDELEFEVLKTCDQVIVVADQTIPSIRSLQRFCESLSEERVVHSLWVVLNRYDPARKGTNAEDVQDMLGIARVLTVRDDFHASFAVKKGRPLRMVALRTPMLHDIDRLIDELFGYDARTERNDRGFFDRVLSALKRPDRSKRNGKLLNCH